jgi:dipeptidyl aminopeptidase/acylaminoacyl peptidase
MRRVCALSLLPIFLLICSAASCLAQTHDLASGSADIQATVQSLFKTRQYPENAISPDGKFVAWIEALRNPDQSESHKSNIYIAPVADPSSPRRITAGDGTKSAAENNVSWSPDSLHLAFLSDSESQGQPQLYTVDTKGGAPKKLTTLKGDIDSPRYSPDGNRISILFTENAKALSATQAAAPELGVIDRQVHEQQLAIIDLVTGRMNLVTPRDMYVYEYDWSPKGGDIAYTAAHGAGDNNWWIAKLYKVNIETSQQRLLCDPPAQIAQPHWSPDGRYIAFISGLMSDQGVTGGDIYLVDATGGKPANITPNRKASPNWLRWVSASGKLLFGETLDGGFAISELDIAAKDRAETLWRGDEHVDFGGVANDGKTASAMLSSWSRAPEVYAGPIGEWRPITHGNDASKTDWGKSENIHWSNSGHTIEGWLLYPANFNPQGKYPLVVSVHGGPASQKSPSWPSPGFDLSVLASQGYFVFFPNPRGSYGQGEAFTTANVKGFGYGDFSDIMTGVDQVLKQAPIDPQRLGIAGWSYGGYMTMWSVTQTRRFKAAVAGAGIANWQSYYGQNLIDQWMIPYFGASVYDDPAVYAKSSPITYIKNARTPTLMVVGERDAECPMPQSREFWHALKTLGVQTELVVYPNEGHHFENPQHIEDVMQRTISWFKANL